MYLNTSSVSLRVVEKHSVLHSILTTQSSKNFGCFEYRGEPSRCLICWHGAVNGKLVSRHKTVLRKSFDCSLIFRFPPFLFPLSSSYFPFFPSYSPSFFFVSSPRTSGGFHNKNVLEPLSASRHSEITTSFLLQISRGNNISKMSSDSQSWQRSSILEETHRVSETHEATSKEKTHV